LDIITILCPVYIEGEFLLVLLENVKVKMSLLLARFATLAGANGAKSNGI